MSKKKRLTAKETRQKFYDNFCNMKRVLNHLNFKSGGCIIGLDLGLKCTGYAEASLKKIRLSYGVKPSDKLSRYKKMKWILSALDTHMNDKNSGLIVLENYSFGSRNMSIFTSIVELGGIARWHLSKYHIPILQVAPTQLKKWILAKPIGDKDLIIMKVYKKFGIECEFSDEADAIVLADIGKCLCKYILNNKLESNEDKHLQKILKNPPDNLKLTSYRWEVLTKLITEQGDKLDQFNV